MATSRQERVATPEGDDRDAELAALRARVGALEDELAETHRRANAAIAAAEDRAYWLDRWHVDLNAIMRTPGSGEVRAVARAVRSVYRWLRRVVRSMRA